MASLLSLEETLLRRVIACIVAGSRLSSGLKLFVKERCIEVKF